MVKIRLAGVEKVFSNKRSEPHAALAGVDLEVTNGEFLCLLGPSGCGKSTLLNLMGGFDAPTGGVISIDGEKVTGPNPRFVTIFQDYGLFPWRNVLGNVEYGLEARGVNKKERQATARAYLDLVGLTQFERLHPHELSGGMKQRVAIARALAVKPEVLFMDEPFGALDAFTRIQMQQEILRIWDVERTTVILVTHDIDEAVYLGDRVIVMTPDHGSIKREVPVLLPRPRDRTSSEFVRIRREILAEFFAEADKPFVYQI